MTEPNVQIFGIKNCDTMKKALNWLDSQNVEYHFHDYKKADISAQKIETWLKVLEPGELINRRGTSWRKLDESERENLTKESAVRLILANPSLVKRPLLEHDGQIYLGFKPEIYCQIFEQFTS